MTAPTRRRLAPHVRRAEMLDAAERAFGRLGYQGTTMEDIAAEAAVTRGLVYSYFGDKDTLYLECLSRAREELEASFTAAVLAHDDAFSQLEAGYRAYFEFVALRGRRWDILFGGGAAVAGPVADEVARLRFRTVSHIAGLLRRATPGLSGEQAIACAHVLSGGGEQLAKWWRTEPDVPLERVVAYHLAATWTGLRQLQPADTSAGNSLPGAARVSAQVEEKQ